ncbi:SET domain protein [Rutstroemia sp. NJR-2017a WRK4]|nr:SET domain protein [Rutstroemia sp. NJR-2017a WRK4]
MGPVAAQTAVLADASHFDEWLAITMKWKNGKKYRAVHQKNQEAFNASKTKKTGLPIPPPSPPKSRSSSSSKSSLSTQHQSLPLRTATPKSHSSSITPHKPQAPSPESEKRRSSSPAHPISNINTAATPPPPPVNRAAEFETEFFKVRKSPKGGLGCFAVKDIPKGTVIHSEKPLFECSLVGVHYAFEQLTPEQREEYLNLYYYRGLVNHKVIAIYQTNRFYMNGSTSGIFPKSSRFNHACPGFRNCTYDLNKKTREMVFTTIAEVARGQELTISYCIVPNDLYRNYGFFCDCPGCPPPEQAMKARKMEKALREANGLYDPEDKPWDDGVLYNY